MDYVKCENCSTVFVNPRPSHETLEIFYQNSKNYEYWSTHIFPISEKNRLEKIFRPRAEKIRSIIQKYNRPVESILEIGAGYGSFIEEIKKFNLFKEIIAIEPIPKLALHCKEKGIFTIDKPIEKIDDLKDRVDVIVSFEVIEHLFSPGDFVQKCATFLKKNGFLILTCPNFMGFEISVLQRLSDSVDIEHLNYFNPSSLSLLLKEYGFDILELLTPGELDAELVRKKVQSGEFDISNQPFLRQIILDDWEKLGPPFQKFLADNCLSSHMWIVGQKRTNSNEIT